MTHKWAFLILRKCKNLLPKNNIRKSSAKILKSILKFGTST